MIRRQLSPAERRDWLRLARAENVGPVTFRHLMRRFGSAKAALEALPEMARRGGTRREITVPPVAQIEDEIVRMDKIGGRFIARIEPDYPEPLEAVEDSPPVIAVRGDVAVMNKRCLGIVGARNASLNGRKMAERLARDLGAEGFTIVSGLARGIDTSAHQASVASGAVAVVAGGVDVVYPEENRALYERIVAQGAVVSDQPLGCEPRAQLFPKRNRIISGLSLGVIVVEAAKHSGSLITARMALEQGREVFAVPGSPLDPRANGTNDLLRQGAVLTENAQDVLRHIHAFPTGCRDLLPGFAEPDVAEQDAPEHQRVGAQDALLGCLMECLGPSPIAVDDLIRATRLPAESVLTALLDLELAGRVERYPGNLICAVM